MTIKLLPQYDDRYEFIEITCYEGEEDPGDGEGGDPPSGKGFTQEDVNRFLAEDRRKHQEKIAALEKSANEALQNAQLTAEERANLESSLSDLRKQFRTKEQEAAETKKQIETEYQQRLTKLEQERNHWQSQYTDSTIRRELSDAAAKHDAFDAGQIVTQLWSSTKMVEVVGDNGKPTGRFEPMVDFVEIDPESGETITTQRRPEDAVKRMAELPNYANFFKSNVASGLSAASATGRLKPGSNGLVNVKGLTPAEYQKIRKENPELLGLK